MRAELSASKAAAGGGLVLRMVDGSAKEFLWGVKANPADPTGSGRGGSPGPTPADQLFVRELVHATFSDGQGYVEELTSEAVDAAVDRVGHGQWPW